MTNLTKLAVLGVFAGLSLVACERRERQPTTMEQTPPATPKTEEKPSEEPGKGGGPMAASDTERTKARDRLATARCDHYKGCGDIAKDKKYDTYDSCMTREKADLDKDWKLEDCPHIDTPRLDACVSAVSAQKCGMFKTSPSECNESKVCIK